MYSMQHYSDHTLRMKSVGTITVMIRHIPWIQPVDSGTVLIFLLHVLLFVLVCTTEEGIYTSNISYIHTR
jgi:hypothetical protein